MRDDIINDHTEKKGGDIRAAEDLVDVLLRIQKENDLEIPLTLDNIKAVILDMFIGGTETAAATTEWAMAEMIRKPEVTKKAQEEGSMEMKDSWTSQTPSIEIYALDRFAEDKFRNTLQGYLKDVESVLELHKASQIVLDSNDSVLEELNTWTGHFLKEYLSTSSNNAHRPPSNHIDLEINLLLGTYSPWLFFFFFFFSSLDLANKELLELGIENFNRCQVIFRKELGLFNRWFKTSGMDKLHFPIAKTTVMYSFLSVAATLPSPELREARLAWAKHGLLKSVFDSFFDVWSTKEEQLNLIKLMEKWDVDVNKERCSEPVKILFLVLKRTISETAAQALKVQDRTVLNHLIQQWVDILRSGLKEVEWRRNKCVPSIEEYERNGITTMALGPIVLSAMYLIGPKLPRAVAESAECDYLLDVLGLHGRYLNDVNGYQVR
ncbi:ent-kaurene synthase-like 2 [Neltuma alba]|uniref:ent-kaurene synthase-like 2 n=1 Tax=Neltuma alba TaxID=207710 RepID=UPI0010A5282C|nr:ent-kaurene synthase-like 2 [Prosopis alba]